MTSAQIIVEIQLQFGMTQLLSHALQIMLVPHKRASSNGSRKAEKKKTNMLMKHALLLYNQKMGKVDQFNQFVATIRSKK